MAFNTAISAMMVYINEAEDFAKAGPVPKEYLEKFVLCLAPFAPHLGEELWAFLGHDKTLAYEPWPVFDAQALVEDEIEIPVQVLGKLRGRIRVPVAATPAEMEAAAKANADVAKFLEGKTIIKVIAVPKRMVNFVVR
jgi:leucyl-tRNA synthetase